MTATESNDVEPVEVIVDPNAVSVVINGKPFTAQKGDLIIKAAENAGAYIPHLRPAHHTAAFNQTGGLCNQCRRLHNLCVSHPRPNLKITIGFVNTRQIKDVGDINQCLERGMMFTRPRIHQQISAACHHPRLTCVLCQ